MESSPFAPWQLFVVKGSTGKLISGKGVTANGTVDCPRYWFSGDTTIILGASESKNVPVTTETVAGWEIQADASAVRHLEQGFLVIACMRYFGGLHSQAYDSRADIFINEQQVDGFALRIKPEYHSDYFHRVPLPDHIPLLPPIVSCRTVYAWALPKGSLAKTGSQNIRVRIDRDLRWDIDYVGLLLQPRSAIPQVFLSYSWSDKEIATQLADALETLEIEVWLDEGNMGIGDLPAEKARTAIDQVQYVIVLLSKNSVKSKWVRQEIEIALEVERELKMFKMLPVILEDCAIPRELEDRVHGRIRSFHDVHRIASMVYSRIRLHQLTTGRTPEGAG